MSVTKYLNFVESNVFTFQKSGKAHLVMLMSIM